MRRKRARKNEAAPASLNKFASLARLELVQRECRPLSQPADDFLPVPHSRSATTTPVGSCTGSQQLQQGRARPVVPEPAIQVKNVSQPTTGAIQRSVDIDLGLKDFAAPSDGEVITA
jgi:hypothetical protein